MVRDPQGRQNSVEAMMEDKGDNVYRCTYRPVLPGPHTIAVTFGGVGVPRSPLTVDVGPGEKVASLFKSKHQQLTSDGGSVCIPQRACPVPVGQRGGACSRQA